MKRILLAVLLALTLTAPSLAGAPLICFPFELGDAESLPWAKGHAVMGMDPGYDPQRLLADVPRLLRPEAPVLARMETLRRATCYAQLGKRRSSLVAAKLLEVLMRRALDAEAAGRPDALAWFDAGYLAACYRQAGERSRRGAIGSKWMLKAQSLGLTDPAVDLALCLAFAMDSREAAEAHGREVLRRTKPGDAVRTHLVAVFPRLDPGDPGE